MKTLTEYNLSDKEFKHWYANYTESEPIPDSIKEYLLDRIESSTNKMDAFYTKCMNQQ